MNTLTKLLKTPVWCPLSLLPRNLRPLCAQDTKCICSKGLYMQLVQRLWHEQEGQDIAEYAVMLAVILVIVVGTVKLIGSNANNVFSSVASSLQ